MPLRFNLQYHAHPAGSNDQNESEVEEVEEVNENQELTEESSESFGSKLSEEDTWKPKKLRPGFERPVMIHRAILGSIERMLAILCEQTGGKWPFHLSPRQIAILPVSEKSSSYAHALNERLQLEGYLSEVHEESNTLQKRIRLAHLLSFNFILVVGQEEASKGTVSIRERDPRNQMKQENDSENRASLDLKEEKGTRTASFVDFLKELKTLEPKKSSIQEDKWKKAYFHNSVKISFILLSLLSATCFQENRKNTMNTFLKS